MKDPQRNPYGELLKMAGLGIQMLVIIGAFAGLGYFLDRRFEHKILWLTLSLSLTGSILSMVYLVSRLPGRKK